RRPDAGEAGNSVEDAVLAQDLPLSRFECGRCMDRIPRTHRKGLVEIRRAAQHRQIDPEPYKIRERQQARAFRNRIFDPQDPPDDIYNLVPRQVLSLRETEFLANVLRDHDLTLGAQLALHSYPLVGIPTAYTFCHSREACGSLRSAGASRWPRRAGYQFQILRRFMAQGFLS